MVRTPPKFSIGIGGGSFSGGRGGGVGLGGGVSTGFGSKTRELLVNELFVQLRRRHAMVLGISVAPGAQRSGVGTALMHAMCDYADNWMGVLRLELSVYVDNAPAIALYHKFGFVTEGRFRGYAMRDGEYVDAFAMARIHPAPPGIAPASADRA